MKFLLTVCDFVPTPLQTLTARTDCGSSRGDSRCHSTLSSKFTQSEVSSSSKENYREGESRYDLSPWSQRAHSALALGSRGDLRGCDLRSQGAGKAS